MGIIRAFERLLGLLCVAVAALLGLFALVGYFADNTSGSRTVAAVIGGLAVLLLVIGLRWLRHGSVRKGAGTNHHECAKCGEKMSSPSRMAGKREACPSCGHSNTVSNPAATGEALPAEDVEQKWEDPALIQDDNAPWRPWMRKGRLYRAIREGRYIRVAYQKKDGEEATTRILYPKKITKGRLRADDLTPGKAPGSKLFIVDRITYVELLPEEWTPMELGR